MLITFALVLNGCGKSPITKSEDTILTEKKSTTIEDVLNSELHYENCDSVFQLLIDVDSLTLCDVKNLKIYVCNSLYDSSEWMNRCVFDYRTLLYISKQLKEKLPLYSQSSKETTFPFQLGKSITIPQLINFGNKKDVQITEKYSEVYTPDCTKAGQTKTYSYTKYDGNDLDDLKREYREHRKAYYWYSPDSSFLYKYCNSNSFDFTKNAIKYDTYVTFFGNEIMDWSIYYNKDQIDLYIKKFGEPLYCSLDSDYLGWDFANMRIFLDRSKDKTYHLWRETHIVYKNKRLYNEWQTYSKKVAEREIQDKLATEQKAINKRKKDSVRLIMQQENDI